MSSKSPGVSNLFVVIGLAFIAVIGFRTISTPEIWTHLAQGRYNAPISFLASDTVVNTSWLYDKLAYTAYKIGKAPLLILLNITGLLAAFLLLIQIAKKWGGGLAQGFALLISGHLIFQSLDVGPQVAMMLFIAFFVFAVTRLDNPILLFGTLIPLQVLWANMHHSFLYGPIIAALAAVQSMQNSKGSGSRKKAQNPQPGTYLTLTAALLLATLVNPYFLGMHKQVFAEVTSPYPVYWSSLFIEYFQIPALKPLILFTMILGACGLITLKKKLPLVLTTLAIFGAFLVWTSSQAAILFTALAFPFIVLSLTSVSEYLHASFESHLGENSKWFPLATGGILVLLLIGSIAPIVTNCAYVKSGSASSFGLGIQENLYPDGAAELLKNPLFPEKAINMAADGGYLAFKYERKCFIDYRPGRYDKELLTNFNNMMLGSTKAYDDLYLEYRPEAFIINTLTPASAQGVVTLLARGIWKLAYFDGTTAILLQNNEKFSSLLNNTDIQKAGLEKLERARAAYAELGGSCRAGNPAELIGSGKLYLAFNRPIEAKAIFSLLLQGNGTIPGAWIGLGNSQLMLKEFDAAVQSLKEATVQAPNSFMAWASYATACKYAGLTDEHQKAVEKARKLAESRKQEEPKKEDKPEQEKPTETSLQDLSVPE